MGRTYTGLAQWTVAVCLFQESGNIVALAVDDTPRQLLFWANNGRQWRAIYRAETNGDSVRAIINARQYR